MPIYRRTDRHRPPLSKQQKLDLFRDCTVVHPHLKKAYEEFRDAISNPGGASIIFLFGPTGVGKTTLLQQISKVMLEEHLGRMVKDSDYLPVATAEARAPESGSGELEKLLSKCFDFPNRFTSSIEVDFQKKSTKKKQTISCIVLVQIEVIYLP